MKYFGIVERMLIGVIGILVGMAVMQTHNKDVIKDFQVDAIYAECAFWTAEGDFDWKPSPELSKFSMDSNKYPFVD